VTKPAGLVITEHLPNEAIREKWQGFHQWNFRIVDHDLKIANREKTLSVSDAISGLASIIEISPENTSMVKCVMRKEPGHQASRTKSDLRKTKTAKGKSRVR
jgi:hypothetical protein